MGEINPFLFNLLSKPQSDKQQKFAVLIDAENISPAKIQLILNEIAIYGVASIKRIYGDWTSPHMNTWKEHLHKYSIQPVQQFQYTTGKGSSDVALIIDAMDILYSNNVNGFCVISSDSDYTRLAVRIRESGLIIYGFGERKTPEAFRQACDKFTYIENLEPFDIEEMKEQLRLLMNKELVDVLNSAVEDVSDETGWAHLGYVGNIIINKKPDFDVRSYGFKKLNELIRTIGLFDIEERQPSGSTAKILYVKKRN